MEKLYLEEMSNNMIGGMFQALAGFLIVFLVVVIVVYIAVGIFLNKFNKLVYGKGTPMAFIPLVNIYLLGKLTVGKTVGIILALIPILNGTFTTNINGIENSYTILPSDISSKVSMIFNIVTFGLLIYAVVLYFKIKKEKENGTYVSEQKAGPLEGNSNVDVIGNLVTTSKDDSHLKNTNVNSTVDFNYGQSNNSDSNVNINNNNAISSGVSTTNESMNNNPVSNEVVNYESSELVKQYQNNNNN